MAWVGRLRALATRGARSASKSAGIFCRSSIDEQGFRTLRVVTGLETRSTTSPTVSTCIPSSVRVGEPESSSGPQGFGEVGTSGKSALPLPDLPSPWNHGHGEGRSDEGASFPAGWSAPKLGGLFRSWCCSEAGATSYPGARSFHSSRLSLVQRPGPMAVRGSGRGGGGRAGEGEPGGEEESGERRRRSSAHSGERNTERELSDAEIRGKPMIYNFAGVDPDPRASRLSDSSKENIWFLHNQNPDEWTVDRLASEYRVRKERVHAILWLKDMEKKMEEEEGKPLDDEIEKGLEKIHGSYTKAENEKHVKTMYTEPNFELVSDDWDGEVKESKGPTLEELSAREDQMLLEEFERRMEFNKKQMEGLIKVEKMDRKRPQDGWSYLIEETGEGLKRGKGGGHRFVSEPDGTHRQLNELEKLFLKRETARPRRRPSPR